MSALNLTSPSRVHLVGIGGIGLSAIARVLLAWGHQVSGSDRRASAITDVLTGEGVSVYIGHDAEHLPPDTDLVIVSSAVPADNPEVVAARQRGIPVVKRAEVLGDMMAGKLGIAVAGTHGKTTIAALIAFTLVRAGLDPTFIVGGVLQDLGTNARAGRGPHFVIEADEYDRTFLGLRPQVAVVTNIEMDHPDCYPDLGSMVEAFRSFLALVPRDGWVIGCRDDERIRELLGELGGTRRVTYGLGDGVDWQAVDVRSNQAGGSDFVVRYQGSDVGRFSIRLPGIHNVQNALAVLAVAHHLDVDQEIVGRALAEFQGTGRRFELKGMAGGVTVIDDYAHHPTQIRATLAAARARFPQSSIWAVFQPHTYSRTKGLLDEYAVSFSDADHVIVTAIYAAREYNSLGVSAADLVARMSHPDAHHIAELEAVTEYLAAHVRPGDVVLTLGAGDGYLVGENLLARLKWQVTS
ncbi:MAG: UDP-N-acetylmuramate--L-alanine ligase [Anaerolineae bacterium]|jgi:UDP-N-acetylmuramate--alanine ligase|nr:UDP-N-acetylmuramate--L-alanine ligase [Anaerolineae bacterium]MDH7473391.1 UDP-N-acetylmuramate--L-alanine ligase [Anaerolineae bacterium]